MTVSEERDRILKRFFTVLFLLCVLAVAALLIAPSFIDWNTYRGDLAAMLSRTAGREVSIGGDLQMALLPSPHLNARDVRIANLQGASGPDFLRVGEVRMQIATAPLFSGRVSISSLLLVEPVIDLEILPDGKPNWEMAADQAGANGRPVSKSPMLPMQLSFEQVSIANGTLVWHGADGKVQRLERVNSKLAIPDLAGPMNLVASATYRDRPFNIELSTRRRQSGQPVPFNTRITLAESAGEISLAGTADLQAKKVQAKASATGGDAAAFSAALIGKPVAGLPAWDFDLESPVNLSTDRIEAPNLSIRLGKLNASGLASLQLGDRPMLKATVDIASLDLDEMQAAAQKQKQEAGSAPADQAGQSSSDESASIPQGMDADLRVAARILRWRDGIIRDAELAAKLKAGVLTVDRVAAKLPGGTAVTLTGKAVNTAKGPRLDGDLAVISDNLRAALVWGGVRESSLPSDLLRAFSYTSRITVLPKTVNLNSIKARFDATRVSGAAVIARRERPSFGLSLDLDRINLDAYLPQRDGKGANEKAAGAAKGSENLTVDGFDANFDLNVGNLDWRDKSISALKLDAQLFKGDLTIRKLTAGDVGGAKLTATGNVANLAKDPQAKLNLTLDGKNSESFASFIGLENSNILRRLGQFRLAGQVTGNLDKTGVDAKLNAIGGELDARGTLTSLGDTPRFDLALSLNHPDGDRVLGLLMPDYRGGDAGPLKSRLQLSGNAKSVAFKDISGSLGDTAFSGSATADLSGQKPDITADISTGVVMLDRLFPPAPDATPGAGPASRGNARWSRDPIDVTGLRDFEMKLALKSDGLVRRKIRIDGATSHINVTNGIATLEDFSGSLFGGTIEATGSLDGSTPLPALKLQAKARNVSSQSALAAVSEFARLEGPVSLDLSVGAAGRNEFEMVSSLAGKAHLSGKVKARLKEKERAQAGVGSLLGVILGNKVKEIGAAGDAASLLIRAFAVEPGALSGDFDISDGIVRTDNLLLDGAGARALTTGGADLTNWTIDSVTAMRRPQDKDQPYIKLTLSGPLDEPNIKAGGTWLKQLRKPAPQTPTAPTEPAQPAKPSKPKPQDFIRDILKSLQ